MVITMEPWRVFPADSNALKVLTYDLVEDNAKIRIDGTQEYSDTTYDQLSYRRSDRFVSKTLLLEAA